MLRKQISKKSKEEAEGVYQNRRKKGFKKVKLIF